jgi:hypothetical protein
MNLSLRLMSLSVASESRTKTGLPPQMFYLELDRCNVAGHLPLPRLRCCCSISTHYRSCLLHPAISPYLAPPSACGYFVFVRPDCIASGGYYPRPWFTFLLANPICPRFPASENGTMMLIGRTCFFLSLSIALWSVSNSLPVPSHKQIQTNSLGFLNPGNATRLGSYTRDRVQPAWPTLVSVYIWLMSQSNCIQSFCQLSKRLPPALLLHPSSRSLLLVLRCLNCRGYICGVLATLSAFLHLGRALS